MPSMSEYDRASASSPTSSVSTPAWGPPRAPLPPHRLAKLANALGVSTPLPAVHSYGATLSSPPIPSSSASSSFPDYFRRSPTPSATSGQTFTSISTTKYLLQVIPPTHLPHDPEALDDPDLLPPPPSASGYHTQFRRGILVPVYPTLSSQLAAIAKEYALPSAVGLIMYLVISPSVFGCDTPEPEEPGPRISEEIWRHIWLRVVRTEKDESISAGLRPIGLGLGASSSPASPSFLHDASSPALRPPFSAGRREMSQSQLSVTPSPSTASNSVFSSHFGSEPEPTESMTSVSAGLENDRHPEDLPLPGLHSPSLIPILAKVEFEIDRRKAAWYEPWLRSRKANHAKRAESRLGIRRRAGSRSGGEDEASDYDDLQLRRAPIELELIGKVQNASAMPSFLISKEAQVTSPDTMDGAYVQLSDDPEDGEEEGFDDDPTTRIGLTGGDPLEDVFGTDAETWAEVHAEAPSSPNLRHANSNVVNLALDGASLSALPDEFEDDKAGDNDEEEVAELWDQLSRPSLIVSIPSPPSYKRQSSPTTAGSVSVRKQPPPPLNLAPSLPNGEDLAIQDSPHLSSRSSGSVHLAYLEGSSRSTEEADVNIYGIRDDSSRSGGYEMVRSPDEEKRAGTFFEELDLGLNLDDDTIEYDESDPHDRRRSQFIMKAQLDEIEKNLIQLSPRRLQSEQTINSESPRRTPYSATLSPPQWEFSSPCPSLRTNVSLQDRETFIGTGDTSLPATPYSLNHINGHNSSDSVSRTGSKSRLPSPPRIAFNGVTTEPLASPPVQRVRSGTLSTESPSRRQKRDDHELYPPLIPPVLLTPRSSGDSPIIPLSPDPFGRFPSEAEATRLSEEQQSVAYRDESLPLPNGGSSPQRPPAIRKTSLGPYDQFDPDDRTNTQTPSSRFSLDSVTSDDAGKSTKGTPLVSMKNIKKLWRKTNNKLSLSGTVTPDSGRTSPNYGMGQEYSAGRRTSRSVSKSPQPGDYAMEAPQVHSKPKRKSSIASMPFMSDSRNTIIPSRTPPLDSSRQPSPAIPPMPPPTPSPSSSPPMMPAVPEKSGVRKSILKSWKSASGSLHAQTNSSTSTPRSSSELLSDAPIKRRRPSILDGTIKRGSMTPMSTPLGDIPPSPALPDEYTHAQTLKRASQSAVQPHRNSMRQGPSPSFSSSSTVSSSPPRPSRIIPGSSPKKGRSYGSSESNEDRQSLDASQYEMVSPKLGAHRIENTLSYPYHTLDHSMTSME